MARTFIKNLNEISMKDFDAVGGKNSSLGEMISNLAGLGINVPGGFAITSSAFNEFISSNKIDKVISQELANLNVENLSDLRRSGKKLRRLILKTPLPQNLISELERAWLTVSKTGKSFAVRSSATAEDLPDASFAGQQETFLNIDGFENLIDAVRKVYASLFTDRAISYRKLRKFKSTLSISVGVQEMVRSDIGSSGVAFTLDTESGHRGSIFITSSYGLGEGIVQGTVNPDEFYVFKEALRKNNFPIIRGSENISHIFEVISLINSSKFDYNNIKTIIFFKSGRFDIKLKNEVLIRFPIHYSEEMINYSSDLLNNKKFVNSKTIDLRINNRVIKYE